MPVTQLQAINVEFKEKATVPPLAEAMVLVDETTEHLEACRVAKWTTPPDHKDLQPAHEALKLKELYTELARTDDSRARPEEYRKLLNEGREIAEKLETALRKLERKETPDPAPDALFTALKQNCKSCHKVYRNTKKAD